MIHFIKEALKEIEHVVWPTRVETRKYFTIVTSMIVVAATVLFVFGTGVSTAMFAIRKITPHEVVQVSPTDTQTSDVLEKLKSLSGSVSSQKSNSTSGPAIPVSQKNTATGASTSSNSKK
jgi:preprotein translocase SecE subunit